MKALAIAAGVVLGSVIAANRPPLAHPQTVLFLAGMLALVGVAFFAGRKDAATKAEATAVAAAAASSIAAAAGGDARSSVHTDGRVQVVVIPAGADPVLAAQLVGGTVAEVDPADVDTPRMLPAPPPPLTLAQSQLHRYSSTPYTEA